MAAPRLVVELTLGKEDVTTADGDRALAHGAGESRRAGAHSARLSG